MDKSSEIPFNSAKHLSMDCLARDNETLKNFSCSERLPRSIYGGMHQSSIGYALSAAMKY